MMPVPTRIIVSRSAGGVSKVKSASFIKFLLKNWYFILVFLFLLPNFIDSVQTAHEMNFSVPGYLALKTGQTVLNADSVLYEDVKLLSNNPIDFIGMENPQVGLWNHTVYSWKVFLAFWKIIGNLFIIFLPFRLIYALVIRKDDSKKWNALFLTFIWGFLFILFMNLIVLVISQASGNLTYTLDPSLNFFQKAGKITYWVLPFHGIFELVKYLISFIQ
jgi:hypothetical protein